MRMIWNHYEWATLNTLTLWRDQLTPSVKDYYWRDCFSRILSLQEVLQEMDMERWRREQLRRLLVSLGDSESSIWWVSQEYFGAWLFLVLTRGNLSQINIRCRLCWDSHGARSSCSCFGALQAAFVKRAAGPKGRIRLKVVAWQKPTQLYKVIFLQLKKNIQLLLPPCTSFAILPRHSRVPQRLFCLSFPKFPASSSNPAGKACSLPSP